MMLEMRRCVDASWPLGHGYVMEFEKKNTQPKNAGWKFICCNELFREIVISHLKCIFFGPLAIGRDEKKCFCQSET